MPFSFDQLDRKTLTTSIKIDQEQEDKTVKSEDFRVVFRDVSVAESKKIVSEVADELEKLTKPIIELRESITKGYGDVRKMRKEIAELSSQNGDSPKKIKALEKQIKDLEAEISEKEKQVVNHPPLPTFQQLHLSKIVVKLPDLEDKGAIVPPTLATFQRLPYNMTLAIDSAIGERIQNVSDPKP